MRSANPLASFDFAVRTLAPFLVVTSRQPALGDPSPSPAGSANINDRSLLGSRDSELAVVIEDAEFSQSSFAGRPALAGRFCASLRQALWRKHLGLMPAQLDVRAQRLGALGVPPEQAAAAPLDPAVDLADVSRAFMGVWRTQAARNTAAIEALFPAVPRNSIGTLQQLQVAQAQALEVATTAQHYGIGEGKRGSALTPCGSTGHSPRPLAAARRPGNGAGADPGLAGALPTAVPSRGAPRLGAQRREFAARNGLPVIEAVA